MAGNGESRMPHVVIVGGGFGGLYAARALARAPVRVTIIDRNNYHLFQPLLYQVATGGLSPGEIATPIRRVLRGALRERVLMADVTGFDLEARLVRYRGGEVTYDHLVVATGARHAYFGHDEWERFAPALKTLENALDIRRRIFLAYEAAERTQDPLARQALLQFVVVGAGPTGVELAGAIAEIARRALRKEFQSIDPADSRIVLLEGGNRVLPDFPPDLSRSAKSQLERAGVQVRLGARVTDIDGEGVHIGSEFIPARTAIWAAGVAASPLGAALGVALDRSGRVPVLPDLSLAGRAEVHVIGDLARVEGPGGPLPGVAPVAMQQGRAVARNILRQEEGRSAEPFRYVDRGSLATIGRSAAVAKVGGLHLSGLMAWLAWLFVHIVYLIGFANRVAVLWRWTWSYLTFEGAARLITGDDEPDGRHPARSDRV